MNGRLALIGESTDQAAAKLIERQLRVVPVIAFSLARHQGMQGMVNVVVPLRCVSQRAGVGAASKIARLIAIVLKNEMNITIGRNGFPNRIGQFRQYVRRGVVRNLVYGVQPQSVKVKFVQPVKRVMNEEVPNGAAADAVEVNCISPGGAMPASKELRRIKTEVVSLGTEMVVDNVEKHHDAEVVRGLNESFEIVGATVRVIGGEWQNAVVAPVASSGEVAEWHQLDSGDSKIGNVP